MPYTTESKCTHRMEFLYIGYEQNQFNKCAILKLQIELNKQIALESIVDSWRRFSPLPSFHHHSSRARTHTLSIHIHMYIGQVKRKESIQWDKKNRVTNRMKRKYGRYRCSYLELLKKKTMYYNNVRQHQYISNWEHNESIYWPEILLFHIIVPYLFFSYWFLLCFYASYDEFFFSLFRQLVVDVGAWW